MMTQIFDKMKNALKVIQGHIRQYIYQNHTLLRTDFDANLFEC